MTGEWSALQLRTQHVWPRDSGELFRSVEMKAQSVDYKDLGSLKIVKPEGEAETHRARLQACIRANNLIVKIATGDGNCQFAALSYLIYGSSEHADELRKNAVYWLKINRKWKLSKGEIVDFESFLVTKKETFDQYLNKMQQDRCYGDNFTLVAISQLCNTRIIVISSEKNKNNEPPVYLFEPLGGDTTKVGVAVLQHNCFSKHYDALVRDSEEETTRRDEIKKLNAKGEEVKNDEEIETEEVKKDNVKIEQPKIASTSEVKEEKSKK
jgi:hypothetical protein